MGSLQTPSVFIPDTTIPSSAFDMYGPNHAPTLQSPTHQWHARAADKFPRASEQVHRAAPRPEWQHAHGAPMDSWQHHLHNLARSPLWIHTSFNGSTSHCSRRGHICLSVLHDWVGVSQVVLPFEELMGLAPVAVGETLLNDPPSQGRNSEPGTSSYKQSPSSWEAESLGSRTIVGSSSVFSVSPQVGPSLRAPEEQQVAALSSTSPSHRVTGKRELLADDSENRPKMQQT